MFVWEKWCKSAYGKIYKEYKMLLLFGFIPLYIYING